MKNILLLTDFSDNARNAIDYALEFLQKWPCKFYILHVQKSSEYISDDLMTAESGSMVYKAVLEKATNKLTRLIASLQENNKGNIFEFQPLVDYDDFIAAITQVVSKNEIDLICMGSNGATGAKEVLFGSNTLQVIRNINQSLLVVPEGYKFAGINSVLFSIHGEQEFQPQELNFLKDILNKYNVNLHVLQVLDENGDKKETDLNTFLQHHFKGISSIAKTVVGLNFPDAISAFEQLEEVDLHALIMEKEGILDRIIFGSENKAISEESQIPLLILPDPKKE